MGVGAEEVTIGIVAINIEGNFGKRVCWRVEEVGDEGTFRNITRPARFNRHDRRECLKS